MQFQSAEAERHNGNAPSLGTDRLEGDPGNLPSGGGRAGPLCCTSSNMPGKETPSKPVTTSECAFVDQDCTVFSIF